MTRQFWKCLMINFNTITENLFLWINFKEIYLNLFLSLIFQFLVTLPTYKAFALYSTVQSLIEIKSSYFCDFRALSLDELFYHLQSLSFLFIYFIKVISTKAKGMIGAFITLILLSTVLVAASTKGWLFGMNKNNGEHVAARIQVVVRGNLKWIFSPTFYMLLFFSTPRKMISFSFENIFISTELFNFIWLF